MVIKLIHSEDKEIRVTSPTNKSLRLEIRDLNEPQKTQIVYLDKAETAAFVAALKVEAPKE
jgi:hypothetical protein